MDRTKVFKWILLVSLSLASTSAFMSNIRFQVFEYQFTYYFYFNKPLQMDDTALLSKIFRYIFPLLAPIIYLIAYRNFRRTISFFCILLIFGTVKRWVGMFDYHNILSCQIIVGLSCIPLIIAPFCIIPLIKPSQRAYGIAIPLFLPILGIIYCRYFNFVYIKSDNPQNHEPIFRNTVLLNNQITVISLISAITAVCMMISLKKQIKEQIEQNKNQKDKNETFQPQANPGYCIFSIIGWGCSYGIMWAHHRRYQIYFQKSLEGISIILAELHMHYTSVLLYLIIFYFSKRFIINNFNVIYILNIIGLVATLALEVLSELKNHQIIQGRLIIITLILLKYSFTCSLPFSFLYVLELGHPVYVSALFFYSTFFVQIVCQYINKYLYDQVLCLGVIFMMSLFFSHLPYFLKPKNIEENKIQIDSQISPFKINNNNTAKS